jgi:hypothetical protein
LLTNSYLRGIGILLLSFGLLGFFVVISNLLAFSILEAEVSLGFTVSGLIVLLLSFYVQEDESAFWSIQGNVSKKLRIGIGISSLLFVFLFFVPIIYATVWPCYGYYVCLSNPYGLESIGYFLIGWGTVYSFELGFLTVWGLLVALLLVITSLVIMLPEVVRGTALLKSKIITIENRPRHKNGSGNF